MSFPFLKKPISPLKMALGEFVLPSVLPHEVDALKTLILAQQNEHAAVVQSMHQAMHQEAAANQCSCCTLISITEVSSRGQTKRAFSRRFCSSQNLLRLQPRILMRSFLRLPKTRAAWANGSSRSSCSTIADRPLMFPRKSIAPRCRYTARLAFRRNMACLLY